LIRLNRSLNRTRPPHLPIGGLDIRRKAGRVHERGLLHPLAERRSQRSESGQIAGQFRGDLHELFVALARELLEL
jgi:hypothetical protein